MSLPPTTASAAPSAAGRSGSARPLFITGDLEMLEELVRLAAAAGVEPEVAPDAVAARPTWAAAPLVLVASDAAPGVTRAGLPRRSQVWMVAADADDSTVWERAVAVGAEEVLFLPDGQARVVDALSECADPSTGAGLLVGVVGGRGGAGASTLAAALAVTGSRHGLRTVLIDGDPLGGGIDMLLGSEDAGGVRWPDLATARGRLASTSLRAVLPRVDELTVLSWDRGDLLSIDAEAMRSVLSAARRGSDLVVVDLPRRPDAAADVALTCADVALIVVPAEVRATAAAARVAAAVGLLTADLRIVVRGPAPSGLPAAAIADALALPLAGELRAEPSIPAAAERGEPPCRRGRGPLATFCADFLSATVPAPARAA